MRLVKLKLTNVPDEFKDSEEAKALEEFTNDVFNDGFNKGIGITALVAGIGVVSYNAIKKRREKRKSQKTESSDA